MLCVANRYTVGHDGSNARCKIGTVLPVAAASTDVSTVQRAQYNAYYE